MNDRRAPPALHSSFSLHPSSFPSSLRHYRLLEFLPAVGHLGLEAGEDAAVHLTDPALAQVQRRTDLLHRHLLEVIEDDNEPLGPAQALGDQLLQVLALD